MILFSPDDLQARLPLPAKTAASILECRTNIANILERKDTRWAIVTGPCSLHHKGSAIAYAKRLAALQKLVEPHILLVMRAHIEKPRSSLGWKGILYDPHLWGQDNLMQGIPYARSLLLELAEKIPLASEFLDPIASKYFSDIISWGFIGARTSASQTHRQLASSLPMPIGFKNSTEGSYECAVYGALAARQPHCFLHINEQGKGYIAQSSGNHNTHIVLRGGALEGNYQACKVQEILDFSKNKELHTPLIIDCSHGNSQYNPKQQPHVFNSVLQQYVEGNKNISGVMLESHIEAGCQPFDTVEPNPYISVTDACMDWSMTERLILTADKALSSIHSLCCGATGN